jgi:hypothetical protein
MTTIQYKGRVWTCDFHNAEIEALFAKDMPKIAKEILRSVHPKKGNICKECARLWDETPPSNR